MSGWLDIPSAKNGTFQRLERAASASRGLANERYRAPGRLGGMTGVHVGRAVALAVPVIALILGGLYAASYFAVVLLGLPMSLGLSSSLRLVGWLPIVGGLALGGRVMRYRRPAVMIVSTYVTFRKALGRAPAVEMSGRGEPLIVEGPHKYTRNPLYFAVVVVSLGWALVAASTDVLIWSAALLLWFRLVLIPFEERELRALFGEQYSNYAEGVPMLVPFTKRGRRRPRVWREPVDPGQV